MREKLDRRLFRRIGMRMEGRIVFAGVDAECLIHEMSTSGAVVECMPMPAIGAQVALDIPDITLTRGLVVRYLDDALVCVDLDMPAVRRHADLSDRLIMAAHHYPPDALLD